MACVSLGQIYVAFHRVTDIEAPAFGDMARVCLVIVQRIVRECVTLTYRESYDCECEERTPEEQAERICSSLLGMPLDTWWEQEFIFNPDAFKAHEGMFAQIPEERHPFPSYAKTESIREQLETDLT